MTFHCPYLLSVKEGQECRNVASLFLNIIEIEKYRKAAKPDSNMEEVPFMTNFST